MLFCRKAGGLNERRFVVEIARPVPDENLETAAAYVAQRLGIDVARIRTLLAGRTGAVSRELAVQKAEAIAKVFGEAGVMVTVVERAADDAEQKSPAAAEEHQPRVDFEYDGPPAHGAESDSPPWEDDRAEDDRSIRDQGAYDHNSGPPSGVPHGVHRGEQRGDAVDDEEPATIDLRPSSTRWVPSPHAVADDTYRETYDDGHEGSQQQRYSEPDESPEAIFYDERSDTDDERLAAIFSEAPARPQAPATGRPTVRAAASESLERDDFGWMGFQHTGRPYNWNPWINSNWLACVLFIERDAQRRLDAADGGRPRRQPSMARPPRLAQMRRRRGMQLAAAPLGGNASADFSVNEFSRHFTFHIGVLHPLSRAAVGRHSRVLDAAPRAVDRHRHGGSPCAARGRPADSHNR